MGYSGLTVSVILNYFITFSGNFICVNNPTHKPVVPKVAATKAGVRPDSISIFISLMRFSPFIRPSSSDFIFLVFKISLLFPKTVWRKTRFDFSKSFTDFHQTHPCCACGSRMGLIRTVSNNVTRISFRIDSEYTWTSRETSIENGFHMGILWSHLRCIQNEIGNLFKWAATMVQPKPSPALPWKAPPPATLE